MRRRLRSLFVLLAPLCGAALLLRCSREAAEAAREGIALCLEAVIPSLFPFLVFSTLALRLGLAQKLGKILEKPAGRLLHLSGSGAVVLAVGLVGGFPVGARAAAQLHSESGIAKEEAERLLGFCSNCGPAFLFGYAAAVLGSPSAGLWLFTAQLCAALTAALLLRPPRPLSIPGKGENVSSVSFSSALAESIVRSGRAVLEVSAFVLFFRVVGGVLAACGIREALLGQLARLGIRRGAGIAILQGTLEISQGVDAAAQAGAQLWQRMLLAGAAVGWSGVSVHFQVLSAAEGVGLRLRYYWIGKLLGTGLVAAISALLAAAFSPPELPAAAGFFTVSAAADSVLLLPALLLSIAAGGKKAGKKNQNEIY